LPDMIKVAYFLLALIPAFLSAQSSVWKVCKGDQTLYIGGTCHVLRNSDYPLPAEFDQAYAAADTLVFEVDPAKLQDPAFATQLLAKSTYTDGRSLKSVLSAEAYAALEAQGKKSGLPIEILNGIKPAVALTMLTIQELAKIGVSEQGVDQHYHNRAVKDGKSVKDLETVAFQIELIAALGDGIENELVLYSLQDLDQISVLFDELILTWEQGDMPALEKLFITDIAQYPELYAKLLVDRNARWLPQLEAFLATPETEFVLVGVAHVAGPDGLLALLREKGHTVNQVNGK
jgi:uncharacterized protein YbaP (TraB family)